MLSLAARRCASAPSKVARNAATLTSEHASTLKAPGNEYPSTLMYKGTYPTHYIPAKDAVADKAGSLYRAGATTQMQAEYGPNLGRYDYGRVEAGKERGLLKIFTQETAWGKRQLRNTAFVGMWLMPMIAVYEGRNRAERYQKEHPEAPPAQPFYKAIFRLIHF